MPPIGGKRWQLVASRACKATTNAGQQCGAPPLREGQYCRLHDPEMAEEVQEARRLGGHRRKREATLAAVYDFEGLDSIQHIRRFLEVGAFDLLGLDPSINKSRAISGLAQVAARLLEAGELEERLEAVEAALGPRMPRTQDRNRR